MTVEWLDPTWIFAVTVGDYAVALAAAFFAGWLAGVSFPRLRRRG
jgi:hypothetical protein